MVVCRGPGGRGGTRGHARLLGRPSRLEHRHGTPKNLHPKPETLNSYSLHPTLCTLHPTPYTLHPTPRILHPTPYTLHPTPYTLHPTHGFRTKREHSRSPSRPSAATGTPSRYLPLHLIGKQFEVKSFLAIKFTARWFYCYPQRSYCVVNFRTIFSKLKLFSCNSLSNSPTRPSFST